MNILTNLAEALLCSLAVVGAAAVHMVLGVVIVGCAIVLLALLRWALIVAWLAGVRAYHRRPRGQS